MIDLTQSHFKKNYSSQALVGPPSDSQLRHWPVGDAASEDTRADYTIQGLLSPHKGTNIRLQVQRLTICLASN